MDQVLQTLIMIATILSIVVLSVKSYIRRDWGIASAIIPRLYLVGILIYDFFVKSVVPQYFHLGILIIFIGDIIANLFIIAGNRFKTESYAVHLVDLLGNLKIKYEFIVEHVPIGIYTLNDRGRFEFANETLARILKCKREDLIGKSALDFFPPDTTFDARKNFFERLANIPTADYKTKIKDCEGTIFEVNITARRTDNGHPTITGCVIKL